MFVSVFRCIVLYLLVIFSMRIMGKRQIGELQPSELVITLMISELAALPMQDMNLPLLWGIMPMFLLVMLELLMSFLTLKSMRFRSFVYGKPVMLIYQGKIDQNALLKTRVSMEDIMEAMRSNNILKVEDIQMAVLETNGAVSILPKPESAPPTAKDLNLPSKPTGGIPVIVVMDGKKIIRNMQDKQMDEQQLNHILKGYGMEVDQVFMLTIDDQGTTFLVRREQS